MPTEEGNINNHKQAFYEGGGQGNNKAKKEKTEIFHDIEDSNNAILNFVYKAKYRIDACLDSNGPSVMIDVESIKEARIKAKNRGVKFRYVTEVTEANISYCKEMIKYFDAEIRHLDDVKGNFEISDDGKEYVATANLQEAKPLKQLIYSNVKEIGEQQQYIFDTLWNKTISFEEKIKEIEEGIIPEVTEVIRDPHKAQELEWNLLKMATKEIQIIYSTVKAYKMQKSVGVIDYLAKLSAKNDDIKIKLLTPKDSSIEESLQDLKDSNNNIDINYIEPKSGIIIKTLVVDKKHSLVMELKDNDYSTAEKEEEQDSTIIPTISKTAPAAAEIGISTYSNSKPTVLSYLSIFETLWRQTELFEQLKQADILKTEFINIAAHELRTPTQTIIGYCEMINIFPEKKDEYINPIKRNSERLYKLTQDILEVSRIESNSLKLDIEKIELNELINETVIDFIRRPLSSINNKDVKINFNPSNNNNHHQTPLFVYADKNRIQQVIFNLLDNASKFTEKGEITLSIIENDAENNSNDKYNDITIRIQDTGKGIDSEILPRLFKKFSTKSERGTGLGLYISKNIVEAHGGKIWTEKTSNGKGSVFVFTLPTTRNHHKK
jgi:two-component system, OmpR family, sensor histidine kinase VicK